MKKRRSVYRLLSTAIAEVGRRKPGSILQKGFTLVEMLVVMSVLSIVSVLILNIFTKTLRGGNKTQIIGAIKQNGQSVLEIMDKTVRNSDSVICPGFTSSTDDTATSDTLVVIKDGVYTRFKLSVPDNTNRKFQQDFPVQPETETETENKNQIKKFLEENICTDPIGADSVTPQTITDTDPLSGVSVDCVASNCIANPIFTRYRAVGFKDQVTIKFDLKNGVGVPQAVAGQIDAVTFQTTIGLR